MVRSGIIVGVALLLPICWMIWSMSVVFPCDEISRGEKDALFHYMSFYRCAHLPLAIKVPLLLGWLVLLISLLASTADLFFVPQLDKLSHDLNLAEDVAGVTLLAFGNGMPDVMTATNAIRNNDFALTMGEFLGAANFIFGLVLGLVLISKDGPTKVDREPFLRDAGAYVFVLTFMVTLAWDGTIYIMESLSFFLIYFVYVIVVIYTNRVRGGAAAAREDEDTEFPRMHGKLGRSTSPTNKYAIISLDMEDDLEPPRRNVNQRVLATRLGVTSREQARKNFMEVDSQEDFVEADLGLRTLQLCDDSWEGLDIYGDDGFLASVQLGVELPLTLARHLSVPAAVWNSERRILAVVSPAIGLQLIVLSFGGWDGFTMNWGQFRVWQLLLVLGTLAGALVFFASTPVDRPRWHPLMLLFAFSVSISWFHLLANECVVLLDAFGVNLGVSSSMLGATVLAWGNSVGDVVSDTALVRQGKSRTAVAAVFGSPLLSDVLGLGVALTSYTLTLGPLKVKMNFQNKVAAMFLSISLASTICTFIYHGYSCPRRYSFVVFGWYATFLCFACWMENHTCLLDAAGVADNTTKLVEHTSFASGA